MTLCPGTLVLRHSLYGDRSLVAFILKTGFQRDFMQPQTPVSIDVVFIGGGHTHAIVLRKLGMIRLPGGAADADYKPGGYALFGDVALPRIGALWL